MDRGLLRFESRSSSPACAAGRLPSSASLAAERPRLTRCSRTLTSPRSLQTVDPKGRDKPRRVLIRDLLDFLVLHKEERREALRLLGEIKATEQS